MNLLNLVQEPNFNKTAMKLTQQKESRSNGELESGEHHFHLGMHFC